MTETPDRAALLQLEAAKKLLKLAVHNLTLNGETDESAMSTLAALDAIDRARSEVTLKIQATQIE